MKIGIIAVLIGTGILAYDEFIHYIDEITSFIAYSLIIVGVIFYLIMERD